MKTRTIVALALPAGIAQKLGYWCLGFAIGAVQMMVAAKIALCALAATLGIAFASAQGGEYRETRETPRIDRALASGLFLGGIGNDAAGQLANNQAFLNTLAFSVSHSDASNVEAGLAAAREALQNGGSTLAGPCDFVCGNGTFMNGFAGALGSVAGGIAGKAAMPVSKN